MAWVVLCTMVCAVADAGAFAVAAAVMPSAADIPQYEVKDIDKLRVIGKGAKSQVWLSKLRRTGEIFALKEIPREAIQYKREAEHVWNERRVLTELSRESFVRSCQLKGTMKDDRAVYFLLEFVPGAPLHQHFRSERGFPEPRARFYCAELVETLGELHRRGIVYRDLKASNVMLDAQSGRLRLVDFGFAKLLPGEDGDTPHLRRTTSVCGTAHAMAPEVRAADTGEEPSGISLGESAGYTAAADWWSLGVLAFEMLAASAPFGYRDGDRGAPIHELAANSPQCLEFPESSSEAFRDFVSRLLTPLASKRLGHGGVDEVRRDPWFNGFDWSSAAPGRALEPFGPVADSGLDDLEDDSDGEGPAARPVGPPSFDTTLGEFASSDHVIIGQEVEGDPFDDF